MHINFLGEGLYLDTKQGNWGRSFGYRYLIRQVPGWRNKIIFTVAYLLGK